MERRSLLKSLGVAVAAGSVSGAASGSIPSAAAQPAAFSSLLPAEPDYRGAFVDRERAALVLEQEGLEGIVVNNPISLYHLTGFSDPMMESNSQFDGFGGNTIAFLPRDPSRPVALVMGSFSYYFFFADVHRESDCSVYQVTDPKDPSSVIKTGVEPVAGAIYVFPDRGEFPPDEIQRYRAEATFREARSRPPSASTKFAVGKALKDLGMDRGKIAVDSVGLHSMLGDVAPNATLVDGYVPMARIKMVKSAVEIKMMRRAAQANAEAALAAVRMVRPGMSYRDLRTAFYTEAARRGNIGVWLIIGKSKLESLDAHFHEGQAFDIDAVSRYQGYHGDYGRTIFMGEPSKPMIRSTRAIAFAWDTIRESLRPGLKFSDIRQIGEEAVRRSGLDVKVRFTPHSVGLHHSDAGGLGDITLEKGMIISVDCPVMEVGIGGSCHLEDLTLITADGYETINDIGDQTLVI
jgi:Xaa-Pro aminopeptidase